MKQWEDYTNEEIINFSWTLSLSGLASLGLQLWELANEQYASTPRWRFIRRFKLNERCDFYMEWFTAASAYEKQQAEATKAQR